jgi:hypothetical protein
MKVGRKTNAQDPRGPMVTHGRTSTSYSMLLSEKVTRSVSIRAGTLQLEQRNNGNRRGSILVDVSNLEAASPLKWIYKTPNFKQKHFSELSVQATYGWQECPLEC